MTDAVVIGAGPAGLMAAEMLADAGHSVLVIEAKPSVGRKLLMAGKSGLNLTRDEPFEDFLEHFSEAAEWLRPMLTAFSNTDVVSWAKGLGQTVFTGSTGRVFPKAMKASPLLRAWLRRLDEKGVKFHTRWRWIGWKDGALLFQTPEGLVLKRPAATVLALGGASWARLGSDGDWADILRNKGVEVAAFQPANMGLQVNWSSHMEQFFGQPVKACALTAGASRSRGEFVISTRGLEGGGIYALGRDLRGSASLTIDLLPDLSVDDILLRLVKAPAKASLPNRLRKALRLDAVRIALLQEFARPLPGDPALLAAAIKAVPVTHQGPRPIDEAISTAGGVTRAALDEGLMLQAIPGVFCAGEMLDWEAPTGGYLLTGCLASGRWAGLSAARWLSGEFKMNGDEKP